MSIIRPEPFQRDLPWTDFVILRLLRRWTAARAGGGRTLPELVQLAAELREPAEAAVALHSVFQLTESCLGRPLEAECCCSRALAPDERAILALIAAAPSSPLLASGEMPHGLPGALCWAVASARLALGIPPGPHMGAGPVRCPFGTAASREMGNVVDMAAAAHEDQS